MKNTAIQRIETPIVPIGEARTFSVIGDPGCEGLGTAMMRVYANALETARADDFTFVVGDLVPVGSNQHYQSVCQLTDAVAGNDVYVLRGNHDTGAYERYFGLRNYALAGAHFTLVVLDNAMRTFEQAGLDLLAQVLADPACRCVAIAFHVPLPNRFTGNAVSEAEFARLRAVYAPHKQKVQYFICGHVHSCFADTVDGIPFICTGGGGAMIEDVSAQIKAADVDHHIVRFTWERGALRHAFVTLQQTRYTRESHDGILHDQLADTVRQELYAHLRYLSLAERAQKRGYARLANLLRALAESEYRHARSFFAILDEPAPFAQELAAYIPAETFEHAQLYPMLRDYAAKKRMPLSEQAYRDAAAAEQVHAQLLQEARQMDAFDQNEIYICGACGYVMTSAEQGSRCPVCGAPLQQFIPFKAQ
nr:ferritin family protein [Maliibacterium massiliense]